MENLSDYLNRFEKATSAAIDYLKEIGKVQHPVNMSLHRCYNILLTPSVSEISRRYYQLNGRSFTPAELIQHIRKSAREDKDTIPNKPSFEELVETLVTEVESISTK